MLRGLARREALVQGSWHLSQIIPGGIFIHPGTARCRPLALESIRGSQHRGDS